MTRDGVLIASREELALYQELRAVYGRLADGLTTDAGPDPAHLGAEGARAAALTAALRDLGAMLSPHRLAGGAVDAEIAAVWRESAALATAAAEANRQLQSAARMRQARITERLANITGARRASAGYQAAAR